MCELKCDGGRWRSRSEGCKGGKLKLSCKVKMENNQNDKAIWKDVLIENYGHCIGNLVVDENGVWPRYKSSWWKDILKLKKVVGSN